ncbi:MAG: energy-coupling factor ABC transporter permease [Gammaproteobacteria bacterium]|nr:energy-coupling factor ABC transporter permease [Gammaproteobacteria bacterium]
MSLSPQHFSQLWIILGFIGYGWILIKALHTIQWWRLGNSHDLNVLLYAMLGVFFIWSLNTDFPSGHPLPGHSLHLLGATLMTLMFGWAYAVIAMSLILLCFSLMYTSPLTDHLSIFPWNAFTTCLLPIMLSHKLFRFVDTRLPNNFFIYIFVCAFFGAAFAIASTVLSTTGLHYLSGAYSWEKLNYNFLPYGLILMLPEAFITGTLMTIFVVYRPEWVSTFDDKRYLQKH